MGATRGRLVSLLFAESLMLTLPAAVLSLPVALLTLRGIASGRTGIPAAAFDTDLNFGAALVAVGVAVGSALAFGLVPARRLLRTDPGKTLQAYGVRQTSAKGVTRFRAALAALSLCLHTRHRDHPLERKSRFDESGASTIANISRQFCL